jgi:hypothetical protein
VATDGGAGIASAAVERAVRATSACERLASEPKNQAMSSPCTHARPINAAAMGFVMPSRFRVDQCGTGVAAAGATGSSAAVGASATGIGIEGAIGAGSDSAMLSETSMVDITLVTAGCLTGSTSTLPELSTSTPASANAPS